MWNILYTLSENRCLVINEIPALWFLFTSHITEPLCMGKAGRIFGTIENNFPWDQWPYNYYPPHAWLRSLRLEGGREESKVFKIMGSGITENGIWISIVPLSRWYLTYLNLSFFICKTGIKITPTLQLWGSKEWSTYNSAWYTVKSTDILCY